MFGGAIQNSFFPSIEKGIRSRLDDGPLAGYPVVDVRCEVYDGKMHPVDSKDIAFQIAGREVFKKTFLAAGPVLLEPIMDVRITVPEEYMGDIMSDLNTRRGRVQGMEQNKGKGIITAQVPLAEMQRYAIDLRSITQGRGFYTMKLSHYEPVPSHIAEGIIAQAKRIGWRRRKNRLPCTRVPARSARQDPWPATWLRRSPVWICVACLEAIP